jgi:large subunit ribosomal protein L10
VPRPEKVAAVEQVRKDLTDAAATLLTNYRGLTVSELAQLRTELRKAGADYKVVKNTLTRRAAAAAGIDGLDDYLIGPTALVFCGDDPVGPSKALKAFAKDHPDLLVKAGYLDGEVLDEAAAVRLADLESREELLAKLAGLMNNALAGFARLLQAPLADQVRLVQALVDDGGVEAKGFSPTAPAEPTATATEAEPEPEPEPEAAPADAAGDTEAPAVVEAATDAVEGITESAAGAVESAAETAADIVESAAETVADAADSVTEAAESATPDDDTAPSDDDEQGA